MIKKEVLFIEFYSSICLHTKTNITITFNYHIADITDFFSIQKQ